MPLLESAHKPVHVTLSGKMLSGNEEWQTGFYMGYLGSDATVPTQAFADAVRDAWATYFTAAATVISASYSFEQVKCVLLEKDGRYGASEPVVSFPATAKNGAYGGSPLPPQVALVATLVAGSGKGLAGKGRMYLPGISAPVNASGHIEQVTCQAIGAGLSTFFDAIDASTEAPGHAINVSRGHKVLLGEGRRNVPINGVRIGNVYDTQRRRRNALAETYWASTVAD